MYAAISPAALHHHIQELFRRRILPSENAETPGILNGHVVAVLFGTCHGEKQYADFIKGQNFYHMSVEDARRFGIFRREDAEAKKLLYVMVQGRGGNGGVHRFRIDGFNGEVPASQIHELGWHETHSERYWLWHVIELPDALGGVQDNGGSE